MNYSSINKSFNDSFIYYFIVKDYIDLFRWVMFDNGFELMIVKLHFIDLNLCKKFRNYGPNWIKETLIYISVIELL